METVPLASVHGASDSEIVNSSMTAVIDTAAHAVAVLMKSTWSVKIWSVSASKIGCSMTETGTATDLTLESYLALRMVSSQANDEGPTFSAGYWFRYDTAKW